MQPKVKREFKVRDPDTGFHVIVHVLEDNRISIYPDTYPQNKCFCFIKSQPNIVRIMGEILLKAAAQL